MNIYPELRRLHIILLSFVLSLVTMFVDVFFLFVLARPVLAYLGFLGVGTMILVFFGGIFALNFYIIYAILTRWLK